MERVGRPFSGFLDAHLCLEAGAVSLLPFPLLWLLLYHLSDTVGPMLGSSFYLAISTLEAFDDSSSLLVLVPSSISTNKG